MRVGCEQAAVEHQETDKRADAVLAAFQDQVPKPELIPGRLLHIVGPQRHADAQLVHDAIEATEPPFAVLHLRDLLGRQPLHEFNASSAYAFASCTRWHTTYVRRR